MIRRKPDQARIEAQLDKLAESDWLGSTRKSWPKFVFHFTDIQNVVSILSQNHLLPRSRCQSAVDTASRQVIDNTAEHWKDYVRLYFRPRTPTQYHNEGIRPRNSLSSLEAHCPVPVYLVFDARDVLTREQTRFSEGNLAAGSPTGYDADYFESIPFDKVYHDSWLSDDEKRTIIFHRHAEVLVPNELDLSALKYIVCRTEAESETLRSLMPNAVKDEHRRKVRGGRRSNLFFRYWTFVESATLEYNRVRFRFNPSTRTPGEFSVRVEIKEIESESVYSWKDGEFSTKSDLRIRIPQFTKATPYTVTLQFDDSLGYFGHFNPNELLF